VDDGMMLYAGGSKNFNEMQDVSGPDLAPVYPGGSKNFYEKQNEMQDVSGPDLAPAVMPSDSWSRRRINFDPTEPVQATSAVMPEPNYSGGLGSLMSGMNGYAKQAQQSALATARQNDQVMRQAGAQPYGYFTTSDGMRLWNA